MTQLQEIKTISPREAEAKMREGTPLLDVREYPEWAQSHIAGSRLVPLSEVKREPQRAVESSDEVLVLCRSGRRATEAAQALAAAGCAQPLVVQGGLENWCRAGLPTRQADGGPISLERQVRIGAGALVLLGLLVPRLRALSYFVSGGLIFAGIIDWCGMAIVLSKMPWNRQPANPQPPRSE